MTISKKQITLLLGIPLSIFFLWIALMDVDFVKAFSLIKKADYRFIILAAAVVVFDFSMRALRWRILLAPIKLIKYIELVSNVFIGILANNVLPLRAGEVIRVFLIGQKEQISKTSAIGTIVIERMLDIFAILSLSIIVFISHPFPDSIKRLWFIFLSILILLIIVLYGLMYSKEKTLYLLNRIILRFLPKTLERKIENLIHEFVDGLEILKKGHQLLLSVVMSLGIWSINALAFYFVAKGMGIEQITYTGSILVMTLVALGISIPSSPGFIGVYEAAGIGACLLLGMGKSQGAAFILLIHAVQILTILAVGMFFLTREHISLIQLEKEAKSRV
jgi:uncharacterized protein (TIRG00374 family)